MSVNINTLSLPYLPELSGSKTTRVITKHFTNLSLYMDQNRYSLLTWLIYQSKSDNSVIYSTHLLNKFRESVLLAREVYGETHLVKCNIKAIRASFKSLVSLGYILPTYDGKMFVISPLLSYRAEYVSAANYKKYCKMYQDLGGKDNLNELLKSYTEDYCNCVNSVISKKIVK